MDTEFLQSTLLQIKHKEYHAFYWPDRNAESILSTFRYGILRCVLLDDGFTEDNWKEQFPALWSGGRWVVEVETLGTQFERLKSYCLRRLRANSIQTNGGADYDEDDVDYCLGELEAIVKFVSESLYRRKGEGYRATENVVVGIQR